MKYRIGWPFWRLLYKQGFPLVYRYEIVYDVSCKRYCALSSDIKGLLAEGDSIEEVRDVMEGCAPEFVAFYVYGENSRNQGPKPTIFPQMLLGRGLIKG